LEVSWKHGRDIPASVTVLTYIRTVVPRELRASGDDGLVFRFAEAIVGALAHFVAANVRAWTLCVVRVFSPCPAVTGYRSRVTLLHCKIYKRDDGDDAQEEIRLRHPRRNEVHLNVLQEYKVQRGGRHRATYFE
jgi:hypothetical protein